MNIAKNGIIVPDFASEENTEKFQKFVIKDHENCSENLNQYLLEST